MMPDFTHETGKIETGNLKSFFHQSLSEICQRRKLETSDSSLAYIVNLLCEYSRSDQFFDYDSTTGFDIRPLALQYGDALEAANKHQRMSVLRRLGDVALFISGIFNASLSTKPVGVDYYIDMGCGAYGWLSTDIENSGDTPLDSAVFRELSDWFPRFVSLLDEFTDNSSLRRNSDLISLYELWLQNRDPRLAEKIRKKGINVSEVKTRLIH
jgi:hypothetical protein